MWDLNFLKMLRSAVLWLVFLSPSAWAALEARVVALEQELSVLRALVIALVPQAPLESQLTVETKVLPVPSGTAAKVADASQGFSYQGFIQLDSLLSRYSDGKPGGGALGRYRGLNAFSDGVVTQSGEIKTYEQIGGLVSWNRRLNRHWQTGVTLSAAWADVPSEDIDAAAGLLPEHYASGHFSLWYRPTGSLSLG